MYTLEPVRYLYRCRGTRIICTEVFYVYIGTGSLFVPLQRDKDLQPGEDGETGQQAAALEKLTRLHNKSQMENFLTYGKWDLTDADIEKLNKDEERKERVGEKLYYAYCTGYRSDHKSLNLTVHT
jgi:hypothetical protein